MGCTTPHLYIVKCDPIYSPQVYHRASEVISVDSQYFKLIISCEVGPDVIQSPWIQHVQVRKLNNWILVRPTAPLAFLSLHNTLISCMFPLAVNTVDNRTSWAASYTFLWINVVLQKCWRWKRGFPEGFTSLCTSWGSPSFRGSDRFRGNSAGALSVIFSRKVESLNFSLQSYTVSIFISMFGIKD